MTMTGWSTACELTDGPCCCRVYVPQEALEHFDPDKTGSLTSASLESGLKALKLSENLSGEEVAQLFGR